MRLSDRPSAPSRSTSACTSWRRTSPSGTAPSRGTTWDSRMPRRSRSALGMYGRPLRLSVRPAVAEARKASTAAATVAPSERGADGRGGADSRGAPVTWSGRTARPRSDVTERCPEGFQSYTIASATAGPPGCPDPQGASTRLHVRHGTSGATALDAVAFLPDIDEPRAEGRVREGRSGEPEAPLARRPAARTHRRMTRCSHILRPAPVALAAAVLLATSACPPARAARPDARTAHVCVDEQSTEARAHTAGDGPGGGEDEDAPPAFTAGFFRHTYTLDVSMDGADGQEIPVSVEEVCDVPVIYAKQAAQLAGADGVAVVRRDTGVFQGRTRLVGPAAAAALDGADTATIRVRLLPVRSWREHEDGDPVPTFAARRVEVTD